MLTKCKWLVSIISVSLAAVAVAAAGPGYRVIKTYKVGGDGGWDYLTADSDARRVYISRGTHVIVIDADSGKNVGDIADTPGVHGIALAPELGRGFVSNGREGTVSIFDIKTLATGYRSSKVVGSDVINEKHETIGKIDDLLISRDQHLYAVLSVGGFLGMGSKLVAVQYAQLVPSADNRAFVLAGATKDSLKSLPEYKYAD